MDYEKHLKPEDIPTAKAEVKCIDCLFVLATKHIEKGDFRKVNERLIDLLNSAKRLEELNIDKQQADAFRVEISHIIKNSAAEMKLRSYFNER